MKPRILSIGLDLDNDQITNADFGESQSLHDFDVVLMNPNALVNFIFRKRELLDVEDGHTISKYDNVGTNKITKRLINQRKIETEHFLKIGRLLVCILRQPLTAYLYSYTYDQPSQKEPDKWVTTYYWLPLRPQDSMGSILRIATGKQIRMSDHKHPFAPYFTAFADQLYYEAYLDEGKMPYYFENFHIIAKTHGELPVGFSFELQGGQVVFLPPAKDPDPKKLAGVLLDCISATMGTFEETTPPSWVSDYKVSLPNLPVLEGEIEKLHKKMDELNKRLNTVEQQKVEQEKYLKLLYEQGKFQLEPVVREAFSLLGFTVKETEPSDGLLESDEGASLLEVEGKDDNAIKIEKCSQLLSNVLDDERKTKAHKKGILVGNGFRLKNPKERTEQFTQRAIDSATGNHFCLLTGETLFSLVCQVLHKPDDTELKTRIRKQLLATDGLFQLKPESIGNEEGK